MILFRHFRRERGSRLSTENLLQQRPSVATGIQGRSAAAPFLPALVPQEMGSFPGGQHHQDLPQAVAVVELGEAPRFYALAKAGERAEGYVLFVPRPRRDWTQPAARQPDEAVEIPLPELLGRSSIPLLEGIKPSADGSFGGHDSRTEWALNKANCKRARGLRQLGIQSTSQHTCWVPVRAGLLLPKRSWVG